MIKNKIVFLSIIVSFSCGMFAMDNQDPSKKIVIPRRPSLETTPPPLNMTPVDVQRARDANSLSQGLQKSPKEAVQEKARSQFEQELRESLSSSK